MPREPERRRAAAALPGAGRMGVGRSLEMIAREGIDGEDTLVVVLTWRCNSRCRFCIVETEIGARLPEADPRLLRAVLAWNGRVRAFRRLVLSGAEVTLRPDLPDLARAAVTEGGFEVVRIQTNGRRLARPGLAPRLVEAGVREYFLSVHAHEEALDRRITRAPGGFREMLEGARRVREAGGRLLANTVVCRDNAPHLPAIAERVAELGAVEAHLWNALGLPGAGQADQLASLAASRGPLLAALDRLAAAGVPATVKWFPRCLLGAHAGRLDNHQPPMIAPDAFQDRLSDGFRFGCPHAGRCRWWGRGCDGLHEGQFERFPGDAAHLRPEAFR